MSNRYLERAGREERIDHRSNAARGLDEIPTIHEGPVARQMEAMGLVSDRCEINRQIRDQNRLIRAIRDEIKDERATLTEDMEELNFELSVLLHGFEKADAEGMKEVRQRLDAMTVNKARLETIAAKAADSMDAEVEKYHALQGQAKAVDADELHAARMELRDGMNEEVREKIKAAFGKNYAHDRFRQADRDVSELLGEPHPDEQRSIRRSLKREKEQSAPAIQTRKHKNEFEL